MFGLLVLLTRQASELSDDDLRSTSKTLSGMEDGAFFDLLVRLRTEEPTVQVARLLSTVTAECLIKKALA